jgi:hypothetical protein
MQIGQITQAKNIYQTQPKVTSDTSPEATLVKKDEVIISFAGQNAEAKWQNIASQYNMTDISTKERASMADELRKNNLISPEQHLRLAAPLSMNDDFSSKVDYLAMIRNSKEVADRVPAALKTFNILEHLHSISGDIESKHENAIGKTSGY